MDLTLFTAVTVVRYFLGCGAVQSGLHAAFFFLGLYFGPEVGGSTFLRNVDELVSVYLALYPRRRYS
jgi:hypothetical protein